MHVSLSIWHRNGHGIYQHLIWISLNAKYTCFRVIALLVLILQQLIQTVVLFLPHPVYIQQLVVGA
jgi:hypothetical protein